MVDSIGSKVSVQSSQNRIVRIDGIDNDPTNQGWLSDKDRFVFESIHSEHRLKTPLVRQDGELREATWGEALELVSERLCGYVGDSVAGLGGANNTNEEAFAFGKFMRTIVVSPHIDAQLDDGLDPHFLVGLTPRASISDLEYARTILLWAADLKEEYPVLYLRVRRAAAELGANLIVVHPRRTGLDDVATHKVRYTPGRGPDVLRELVAGDGDKEAIRAALNEGPVIAIVGRTGLTEDPRLAEAVAAYDMTPGEPYHPKGEANSYLISVGGLRLFFSAVGQCVPEVRALENIDVAVMPMNLPVDRMRPIPLAECLRTFSPGVFYINHYDRPHANWLADPSGEDQPYDQDTPATIRALEEAIAGLGVEFRDAGWYPPRP